MLLCVHTCQSVCVCPSIPLGYSQPGLLMIKERTKQLHAIKNEWQ